MNPETTIRLATTSPEDLAIFGRYRAEMFRDMGWTDEERLAQLAPLYEEYLLEHFARGDFVGWIAQRGDESVGAVGLLWERVPPTVRNLTGRQAYILGMYVAPGHRRQGVASQLIDTAVAYAREHGAAVVSLHYSPAGKGLYEKLGFVESPEMRLFTDPASASWAPQPHRPCDDAD